MQRPKLKAMRKTRGFTQEGFAERCGVSVSTVQRWEAGEMNPQPCHLEAISDILDVSDLHEIDIYEEGIDPMEYTRRKIIAEFLTAAGIPFIVGDSGPMLLATPVIVTPGEFLAQSNASLKACWRLLDGREFGTINAILSTCLPTLSRLALAPSKYQDMAANLSVQAKLIQAHLAFHRQDFATHEAACMQAVEFGELTSDVYVHATALLYYGYIYINHAPYRPEKAIPYFNKALSIMQGRDLSLLHADLAVGLANTHALHGDEANTLEALSRAELIVASSPQQTPDFLYSDGYPEFYRDKGKIYLCLAPHFQGYAQKALDALAVSGNLVSTRSIAENAILQADAARLTGNRDLFAKLLEHGISLASQINSAQRQHEARVVFSQIPDAWRAEPDIVRLQHNIPALAMV